MNKHIWICCDHRETIQFSTQASQKHKGKPSLKLSSFKKFIRNVGIIVGSKGIRKNNIRYVILCRCELCANPGLKQ